MSSKPELEWKLLRVFAFENGEENLKTSKWLKSLATDWNHCATRACIECIGWHKVHVQYGIG